MPPLATAYRAADIGILSSLDQACMDLIYQSKDPEREHLLQQVEALHGTHTIDAVVELGFGTKEYKLITIDQTVNPFHSKQRPYSLVPGNRASN